MASNFARHIPDLLVSLPLSGISNVFSVCPARYKKQSGGSEPFRHPLPNLGNNATPEFKWSVSTGRYISFYFAREFTFFSPLQERDINIRTK